jgi:hypothetical protein
MAQIRELRDPHGVIYEAVEILPDTKHKVGLVETLAELEQASRYMNKDFPKARMHKVAGIKQDVFRADINKHSGWRMHVQHSIDGKHLILNDVLEGKEHDAVVRLIKTRLHRYVSPRR